MSTPMKRWIHSLPGFVLATVLPVVVAIGAPASAQTLYAIGYGSDGPATLYTVDPATGTATQVGAVGFDSCSGMDFNSVGALFAACERSDGSGVSVLVRVNSATGVGTEVGPTGLSREISDLSFRADGTLFAYDDSNNLHTLNTITGAAHLVGLTNLRGTIGNALSFVPAGTLYGSQLNLVVGSVDLYLHTLDPVTGAYTFIAELDGNTTRYFNAMDAHPDTGMLFAIYNEGPTLGPGPRSLFVLDPVAVTGKLIGPTGSTLYALAWGPTRGSTPPAIVEVPALGTLGLALLGVLLTLAAGVALRKA